MIPILYEKDETEFQSEGIGRLADCTKCIVTEERNGTYECEFSYPVSGPLFTEIKEDRIIFADHDDSGQGQPFIIYARSEPIDEVVTFNAHHLSYRLSNEVVTPIRATTVAGALEQIKTNAVGGTAFTFWTDKDTTAVYQLKVPALIRSVLGGEEDSLLATFGDGEYEFDKFAVKLWGRRGHDTDVEVRYGKNMVDYTHTLDVSETYDAVLPYWFQEGSETEPSEIVIGDMIRHNGGTKAVPLDLSDHFEEKPTKSELMGAAVTTFDSSRPWIPQEEFEIDFAALWQTEEFKEYAPFQRLKLCDTVLVYFLDYGVEAIREKVVKTVYNVLLDRYDEIVLNTLPATFSGIIG